MGHYRGAVAPWTDTVLAQKGGWDEIALVVGPLLLLWLLLVVANRRAKRMSHDDD